MPNMGEVGSQFRKLVFMRLGYRNLNGPEANNARPVSK